MTVLETTQKFCIQDLTKFSLEQAEFILQNDNLKINDEFYNQLKSTACYNFCSISCNFIDKMFQNQTF